MLKHSFNFIFLWGGRGSAKTSDVVKILVWECMNEDYMRCVVILKDANKLREGIYQQFVDFIRNSGLSDYFDFKESTTKITCKNGNVITFRNGKDAKNIKGLANYNYALFEEVDQIEKDDYDYIVGTVRSINGSKYRIYHTFNPESGNGLSYKDHWIYKNHFEGVSFMYKTFKRTIKKEVRGEMQELKYVYIHSTLDDNEYCPAANVIYYESFKEINKAKYMIWRWGKWSNKDTESQFAHKFDADTHVKKIDFIPDLPIHLSFDQNFRPYSTCTVWQIVEEDEKIQIRQLDEICLTPPNNETENIVNEILERYYESKFIIYGDFSGGNRKQNIEKTLYRSHYDYIKRNLGEKDANGNFITSIIADRIRPNPPRMPRREIINKIFSGQTKYEILIHPRCKNSISDWEQGEVGSDGMFDKNATKKNGVEMYGHCMDTAFYLLYGLYKEDLFRNSRAIPKS